VDLDDGNSGDNLEFVAIELRTECPKCAAALPLDRPELDVACPSCGADVKVPEGIYRAAVGDAEWDLYRLGRGVLLEGSASHGGQDVFWTRGRDAPPCGVCSGPTVPSGDGERVVCPEHGDQGGIEKPPRWLTDVNFAIRGFVDRDGDGEGGQEAQRVAMTCSNCGSSLTADGTKRAVSCEYCNTMNVMPKDVWEALHPPAVLRRWWLAMRLYYDPRRETPSASEEIRDSLGTLGCGLFIFLPIVAVVIAAFVWLQEWLQERFGVVGFWIFVGILAAAGIGAVAYCVPYLRRYLRWRKIWKPGNEVVGRLGEFKESLGENGIVKVELTPAGEPGNVIGTTIRFMSKDIHERLGGEGGEVRAWVVREKPWLCEVRDEPTVLE
jgi:DNA-directed RNA polymerase subunit RPC12/RpoP